jgi:hypothetical protein
MKNLKHFNLFESKYDDIQISTYQIETGMGKYFGTLPFLTKDELKEFNNIGYTGKDLNGNKTSRVDFLNSLNKGKFKIDQTKFDDGEFIEQFIITWIH